jgi:transcriptional regulator with GAF, ATPase, and Fis domain/tetratricopeptide (TPR) repeat protein
LAALLNNRYRVLRPIGGGAQGAVFLAEDTRAGEGGDQVALKGVAEEQRQALLGEFERLSSLSHPGIARVLALHTSDLVIGELPKGSLYFASEFIDGRALADDVLDCAGLAKVDLVLRIAAQLASALSHLHAHDLVHNDIKPDNILRRNDDGRVVLVDLGLTGSPGMRSARGSVAYMAPEALTGLVDVRSDLYSVGVTLAEYALGERLFPQEKSGDLVAAILQASPDGVAQRFASFPPAFVELLQTLLASDPSQRPSGANALLAHVARVRESLHLPAQAAVASAHFTHPEFVGRQKELAAIAGILQAQAEGEQLVRRLSIVGEIGSGRRRLASEALLRCQARRARTRRPALAVFSGSVEELWPEGGKNAADFLSHYAAISGSQALLLLLDDEDPRVEDIIGGSIPPQLLVMATRQKSAGGGDPEIVLGGLSAEDVSTMCNSLSAYPVPESWIQGVIDLSQGLPGRVCEFMQIAASLDPQYAENPETLLGEEMLSASLLRRLDKLNALDRSVLEVLVIANTPWDAQLLADATSESAAIATAACESLVVAGLVRRKANAYQLSSPQYARVIESALSGPRRRALHRLALTLAGPNLSLADEARHLLVAGPIKEARRVALAAISERSLAGRHDQALRLCVDSAGQLTGKAASDHAATTAEIALTTGDYELAAAYADKAQRSRDAAVHRRGVLALARCAQHQGDLKKATDLLASLVKRDPLDPAARASHAKALCAQGDFSAALMQAEKVLELEAKVFDLFLAHEVAGLANLYLGEVDRVAPHFEKLATLANDKSDLRLLGRAQGLRGMLAQKQGDLALAGDLYAEAARLSMESGAGHAAAVFSLNSATVQQRAGRYAAALEALQGALRQLGRSGTPFQLAAAHCNRGNVLLALGELDAAREEAIVAQTLAENASEPRIHYYAHLLLGDIAFRRQASADAADHYRDAAELATGNQLTDGVLARMALQEVEAMQGGDGSTELRTRIVADTPEELAKSLASHVRVMLILGEATPGLADELEVLCQQLKAEDDLDLGWQVAVLAARIQQSLGDEDAYQSALERASSIFQSVIERTPEAYRAGLRSHPDAQALDALSRQRRSEEAAQSAHAPALPLLRLLALSRRLNSEQRLDALVDDIIDAAVELSRAERAFLLLRTDEGALEVRVARNIDRENLGEEEEVSRSIAEKVARTGQVILTVDAEQDGRFGASLSVAALRLRSILAVPFRVKSRIVGTLYLDHRFRRGAFDDEAVEVVRELAGIAAIAIENARLATGIRRRQAEIDALNLRLESRLESTEAELATARAKIPNQRPAQGFTGIIGDSPALRDVLAIAERAADCDLPVVIFGESGTGKELLARAIHENSDRRDQAFVALNCGAVPDSLLEAELFGHRRGAFTGADRARQGLFRVADGGTLFLDEIADTSLAMQSKLLRALQNGEIRPLGAEEAVHVNIRVLCASNQRLEKLVEEGRFREDLYYRLKVLSIVVPPLSERRSDIKALALHIMGKLGPKMDLSRAVLRTLQSYAWPGNVRELENELTRACAMAETNTLEPHHLSPALQSAVDQSPVEESEGEEGLLLKPQVELLERDLVTRAMRTTQGNQSRAAELLGLSRYGLQKKLQRYGISRSAYSDD